MKKLLISLIIIMNLIFIPVFADSIEDIVVNDTVADAVNATIAPLNGYGLALDYVHNYIVNNNIVDSTSKYILVPTQVDYVSLNDNIYVAFDLLVSSSTSFNDKFVAITLNRSDFYGGHYDLWVGYTGQWSDITATRFNYIYDYSDLSMVDFNSSDITSNIRNQWGCKWQTNFLFDSNGNRYLLVSDEHSIQHTGGLYYSLYSSQDLLTTYYGEFGGAFGSGTWDTWYTVNPNYIINVFRNNGVNITNVNTGIYVNSYGITFDNNGADSVSIDYNINAIWGTLKNSIFNLLAGFGIVIQLFTVIFAWLPPEFVFLIYSALILAITLLVIKVLRGG